MKLLIIKSSGIIEQPPRQAPGRSSDWSTIPGSVDAIARATLAGIRCVVISDRFHADSGVTDMAALNRAHQRMLRAITQHGGRVEAIFFRTHGPEQRCDCDDADGGILRQIAQRTRVPCDDITLIADLGAELAAASTLGMTSIRVRTAQDIEDPAHEVATNVPVRDDLASAVDMLIPRKS